MRFETFLLLLYRCSSLTVGRPDRMKRESGENPGQYLLL
nr:MAG TPA: hypothetical protein [Herelleviridae sp.]